MWTEGSVRRERSDARGGRRVLGAMLVLVVLSVGVLRGHSPAAAGHGGAVQLARVPAGPYALSVWTESSPRPGPWRVDVAVMRDGDRPVLDAAVRVRVEPLAGGGAPAEVDARREADPLGVRYRADVPLGADGPWRVIVAVTGPDGHATAAFPIDVGTASWPWWPTALGSAAALAAGLLWGARRRRAALSVAALVTLAVLAGSTTAEAHASLVRSSPARRATLTTPPDRVQLWFNEAVEPRFSTVSVWSAAGQQVDLADARVEPEDPKRLVVGVGTLGPGTYRVKFRVLSVDGHVVESEFTFTIR